MSELTDHTPYEQLITELIQAQYTTKRDALPPQERDNTPFLDDIIFNQYFNNTSDYTLAVNVPQKQYDYTFHNFRKENIVVDVVVGVRWLGGHYPPSLDPIEHIIDSIISKDKDHYRISHGFQMMPYGSRRLPSRDPNGDYFEMIYSIQILAKANNNA